MKQIPDHKTLAMRAINASNTIYKPTYAGLRLLLASVEKHPEVIQAFLERRCSIREKWRYFAFQIVKDAADSEQPNYRNCISGSPLIMLAEASILSLMCNQKAFAVPKCAYSYLWPKNSSASRNFAYFYEGYRQRSAKTSQLLRANPGDIAIVSDIKGFYPNVDKATLAKRISKRTALVLNPGIRRRIEPFIQGFLDPTSSKPQGLPIGPDLSHALGHVALESLDEKMQNRYRDRYLRYVDDIILVVNRNEVRSANAALAASLDMDLEFNETKDDQVDSITWLRENPIDQTPSEGAFESLIDALAFFMICTKADGARLGRLFQEAGFSIPISRVTSLAKSNRFWKYLSGKWSFIDWFRGWFVRESDLVKKAQEVRIALWARAVQLSQEPIPSTPTRLRWWVQKRRYVFNRLLYLLSPTEYKQLASLIPDGIEFQEIHLLLQALATGDATPILKHPGRCVAAFCQLWPQHHGPKIPSITWPAQPTRAQADSAAHLALLLPVTPPDAFLKSLEATYPGTRILIDCCAGQTTGGAVPSEGSFLDEIGLLFNGMSRDDVQQLISARFDELEDIGFDGLLLGSPFSACPS
jgi:RNase P/RNase MRP subunit POP5